MPLNSHTNNNDDKQVGSLYIVATPIGNMDDITIRAVKVLSHADIIAAEDTRNIGQLFAYHHIEKKQLIAYHEHNEKEKTPDLIGRLKNGQSIALVSDAGTPSVSDPGYRLLTEAIVNKIKVIPVPGPSAAITALSVAGLPTDAFVFVGFLSKKKGKRKDQLLNLAGESRTIIIYESPKRIVNLLSEILEIMGDRNGLLAREMTKTYEEFIRGNLSEIFDKTKKRKTVKGECTLLISGLRECDDISEKILKEEIIKALESPGTHSMDIAKSIAQRFCISKKKVYNEILKIKKINH